MTDKPTPLYRITKERWEPEWDWTTRAYNGTRKCDKREVVITERKARVSQTVKHAKKHNDGMRNRYPDDNGRYTIYKVYVEVSNDPVEFTGYAEET